ncbi:MAG: hypothetical protein AB8H03_28780 [Saprospiraceae bacterium]
MMYELAVLTEEFFVTMHLRKKEFQRKKILVEELGERNLYAQFEKGTKQLMKELKNLPYRDTFFYKDIYELNYNYSNHQETNRQKLNGQILKIATEHLDYFYLLQKQQFEFAIKSHEKLFKEKIEISTIRKTKVDLQKEPIFNLYQIIIKGLSVNNNEVYLKLESLFKEKIYELGRNDKVIILKVLLNYSSRKINEGREKYYAKMLSLYKFGLKHNLLIENGLISETTFTNIITIGSYEKEFKWVEQFIEKTQKYLPLSVQKDATCSGLSLMFFYKKEQTKTIDLILNHTFSKPLYILKSKSTLLRAFFELFLNDESYYELITAQIKAFEKFIRRNNLISIHRKESYLNFILFIQRITEAHWKNSLDQKIYDKLKNTNPVLLKSWLLEKIETVL